uniref:uncharacterized protein LOC125907399 n=1 Tax=Anopheles coluzzii TaxID=1518534 RepID=UPI0020FFD278|nr:uncharacterized protein LOC125907399 [Anopheles coluzzii]
MVVYIPPQLSSEISTLRSLHDCNSSFTLTLKPSDLLFVIGDFNQPSISWSIADPSSSPTYSSITHYEPTARSLANNTFVDGFKFNGLMQLNHINNSHGRMLDLLYANNAAAKLCSPVFPSVVPLVPLDSYHPAFDFNIRINSSTRRNSTTRQNSTTTAFYRYNFAKADYVKLNDMISMFNNSFHCSNFISLDEAVCSFSSFMLQAFVVCVTVQRPKPNPPWADRTLKRLKRVKRAAYRHYQTRRCQRSRSIYFDTHSLYCSYNRRYGRYLSKIQRNLCRWPDSFWRFYNSKTKSTHTPKSITYKGATSANTNEMCILFADRFADCFSPAMNDTDH